MKFIYSYEDLFGDGEPTVDIMLRARDGGKLTLFQRMFLPDGLRHYAKSHIIMNFAYTEEDGRRPFMRTLVCGRYYQEAFDVADEDLLVVMLFPAEPDRESLKALGYEPTKDPGIYRSTFPLFQRQIVIVFGELRNTLRNAPFKLFARSQESRQGAYKTLLRFNFPGLPAPWRGVIAKLAALTEKEVDNFDEKTNEALLDTLKGPPDKGDAEPFADTTPSELADEVEAFLRKDPSVKQ